MRIRSLGLALIAAASLATACPPSALAQNRPPAAAGELNPPVPAPPKTQGTSKLITMLEAILLAAMIIGVNLIPSKRGHQD
jgi:hypothetical protein